MTPDIKKEFTKIRKEIDIDDTGSLRIEETIKQYGNTLISEGKTDLGNNLVDIGHFLRFNRSHPDIQSNLCQYIYWHKEVHNGDKSY